MIWLKKVATAEGIRGRLPYTIVESMCRLLGWKRFETNKELKLEECDRNTMEALLRRFLAIVLKARFYEKQFLDSLFQEGDWEQYGIFARDPSLKAFVESDPGIAASMVVQNMFELDTNKVAGISSWTMLATAVMGELPRS